ncbi:YegP family protein [Mycobacterium sp. E2733]
MPNRLAHNLIKPRAGINGQIIASSEGCKTKAALVNGIKSVQKGRCST